MRTPLVVALASVVLLGCPPAPSTTKVLKIGKDGETVAVEPGEFPIIKELPDFSLTERAGGTVTRADLLGKIWVADFIFTTCKGPCPLMTTRMSQVQAKLTAEAFPDLRFVSITVDPETDTPEALSKYADNYGAEKERWLFLTGAKAAIYALVGKDGFLLPVGESPDEPGLITHSVKFALVDKEGRIRAYFDGTSEPDVLRLAKAIAKLRDGA
jgi:protein SCO1/2